MRVGRTYGTVEGDNGEKFGTGFRNKNIDIKLARQTLLELDVQELTKLKLDFVIEDSTGVVENQNKASKMLD